MACRRCQGLMVGCILDKDLQGWIWGWRCANCGFLVDPRVDRIRQEHPLSPAPSNAEAVPALSLRGRRKQA